MCHISLSVFSVCDGGRKDEEMANLRSHGELSFESNNGGDSDGLIVNVLLTAVIG